MFATDRYLILSRRLRSWWTRPVQLPLPLYCGSRGERCDYAYPKGTGYWGVCVYCGTSAEPDQDR